MTKLRIDDVCDYNGDEVRIVGFLDNICICLTTKSHIEITSGIIQTYNIESCHFGKTFWALKDVLLKFKYHIKKEIRTVCHDCNGCNG